MNDDLNFIVCRKRDDYYVVCNDEEKKELVRRMKKVFENNWQSYARLIKIEPDGVPA